VGVPEGRPLLPLVHVSAEAKPLEKVLQEVAKQSGYNVVLDPRSADKGATPIKANLNNVPVDNAVRLLADMADLKMVQMGNILYVTTAENAAKWEKQELPKPVPIKRTSEGIM
jgi:type II secretory pathway component HofQ